MGEYSGAMLAILLYVLNVAQQNWRALVHDGAMTESKRRLGQWQRWSGAAVYAAAT